TVCVTVAIPARRWDVAGFVYPGGRLEVFVEGDDFLDAGAEPVATLADANFGEDDAAGRPELGRALVDVGPDGDLEDAGEVGELHSDEGAAVARRQASLATDDAAEDKVAALCWQVGGELGCDLAAEGGDDRCEDGRGARERVLREPDAEQLFLPG